MLTACLRLSPHQKYPLNLQVDFECLNSQRIPCAWEVHVTLHTANSLLSAKMQISRNLRTVPEWSPCLDVHINPFCWILGVSYPKALFRKSKQMFLDPQKK
jgi:hypothetical protein